VLAAAAIASLALGLEGLAAAKLLECIQFALWSSSPAIRRRLVRWTAPRRAAVRASPRS